MPKSRNENRLDEIEIQLTPKQWAIRLVDEIRRYPDVRDFLRAIAKGTYRESPFIKPCFALAKQAELRHPGSKEALWARFRLNCKLRREYSALKTLIVNTNEEIEVNVDKYDLRIRALTNQLQAMMLRDTFARASAKTVALIEKLNRTAPGDRGLKLATKELADVALAGSHACLFSLAREWADEARMLLMEIFGHKAAVQNVQDTYFDGHPMLHPNIEDALESALERTMETVATFDQFLDRQAETTDHSSAQEVLPDSKLPFRGQEMDWLTVAPEAIRAGADAVSVRYVADWERSSKNKATADILEETGEHGDFVWKNFREQLGVGA